MGVACRGCSMTTLLSLLVTILVALLWQSPAVQCQTTRAPRPPLPRNLTQLFADVYNNNSIAMLLREREPDYTVNRTILQIAPGAFMAYNYAMGNSLWVVTPQDTIIVMDTPESNEAAVLIRQDMRKQPEIGNKTISFIIFTIYHADHTFGARPFIEDPANNGVAPVIISHKKLIPEADHFDTFAFIKMKRVVRVFGSLLPSSIVINAFTPLSLGAVQYVEFYPTILLDLDNFGDTQDVVLNGLPLQFVFIPGYTADHLAVWFPTTKLIHAADVFYTLLPNIYTIRGEPARDALAWSKSARLIQTYNAEFLYPSHSHPLIGRDLISSTLEKYADAIQYIHDQTVRFLAKGHTPDAISRMISLPETLATNPNLAEFYGMIEGHSKAVADRYTGWFNGEAEDLLPCTKTETASRMVRDFGRGRILLKVQSAYATGDYRWALTLATHVWISDGRLRNDALYWRTQAMKRLAESVSGVQWRQYLYSEAMINWGFFTNPAFAAATLIRSRQYYMRLRTIENCLNLLSVHLDSRAANGIDKIIDLRITDDKNIPAGQVYRIRIRNSVMYFQQAASVDPLQNGTTQLQYPLVETNSTTWRQILAGSLSASQSLQSGAVIIRNGQNNTLTSFLSLFDFVDEL